MAKRKRMTTAQRKAAKAVGQGKTYREAAKKAGLNTKRSAAGVTVAEWMRDPRFVAAVNAEAEKAMSSAEWDERNARMARGEIPGRVVVDGKGRVVSAVYELGQGMERQGNALGKLKDRHILTGPNDGPIQHELAGVPEAELRKRLAMNLKALGGAPASE